MTDGNEGKRARNLVSDQGEASVPDLADVETVAVLRKRWLAGTMSEERFESALTDLTDLPFPRYPALHMLRRTFELRGTLTHQLSKKPGVTNPALYSTAGPADKTADDPTM